MYPLEAEMSSPIDPEVGRRLQSLRRSVGLSREHLAGLAEVSPTLIKFVEGGRRALTLRTAQRLAPHLGVRDLADLYGPDTRLSLDARPSHPSVPAVRKALTDWKLAVEGEPSTPAYLRSAIDSAWRTWHTSPRQRSEVGELLPNLLTEAQRAARLATGDQRRPTLAMLAEAHHVAQAFLAWHGDRELVWLTVDRGMSAALESEDVVTIGGSVWYAAHLLRAVGREDEALERLAEARALVEPTVADGGTETAAMLADLYLCTALTLARKSDPSAWASWSAAADVVSRALPADYAHPWTRVGPALIDVYAVQIAAELGDPHEARRRAQSLDPRTIPSTERRARHLVELARVADQEGSPEAVLHLLTQATNTSTETVEFSPISRDMIKRLVTNGPATIRADAEALARRAGVEV